MEEKAQQIAAFLANVESQIAAVFDEVHLQDFQHIHRSAIVQDLLAVRRHLAHAKEMADTHFSVRVCNSNPWHSAQNAQRAKNSQHVMFRNLHWFCPLCGTGRVTQKSPGMIPVCKGRTEMGRHIPSCMVFCGSGNQRGMDYLDRLKEDFSQGSILPLRFEALSIGMAGCAEKAYSKLLRYPKFGRPGCDMSDPENPYNVLRSVAASRQTVQEADHDSGIQA